MIISWLTGSLTILGNVIRLKQIVGWSGVFLSFCDATISTYRKLSLVAHGQNIHYETQL